MEENKYWKESKSWKEKKSTGTYWKEKKPGKKINPGNNKENTGKRKSVEIM